MAGVPSNHVLRNRQVWDAWSEKFAGPGERAWASDRITWGIWNIAEDEVRVLPDVAGSRVLELGCGTAYISAWLARRGARVIGLDNSSKQLATARRLQSEFDLRFPLIHANAEMPPLADETFDLVISEYGASIWCDPYRWVPQAYRMLRPGGQLIFLRNSTIQMLCMPEPEVSMTALQTLSRDYFGLHRIEWSDDHSVEFVLPYGKWIELFRRCGFVVEALVELQAPPGAVNKDHTHVSAEWAQRWPSEEIWRLQKPPA
jgi:SAM-dependent methyltransferase